VSGLEAVPNLRVLMLGRNRISAIQGLEGLSKLDVLDLHNNKISSMRGVGAVLRARVRPTPADAPRAGLHVARAQRLRAPIRHTSSD
jgi:Leucine-rich repeat (LRR) protein